MTIEEAVAYNHQNKFNPDGSVKYFPGNTVISFIHRGTEIFSLFKQVRHMLQCSAAGECVSFLPDDSIHMTVFEGVCDQWRSPDSWTKLLPMDATLSAVDTFFESAFAKAKKLGSVSMKAAGLRQGSGYMISLMPLTQIDSDKLKEYRNQLSELFGLRFPNHDSYGFHISLCYMTRLPDESHKAAFDRFEREADAYIKEHGTEFVLEEPVLTYFRNMFGFEKTRFERP